jgi:hypothetical protein
LPVSAELLRPRLFAASLGGSEADLLACSWIFSSELKVGFEIIPALAWLQAPYASKRTCLLANGFEPASFYPLLPNEILHIFFVLPIMQLCFARINPVATGLQGSSHVWLSDTSLLSPIFAELWRPSCFCKSFSHCVSSEDRRPGFLLFADLKVQL